MKAQFFIISSVVMIYIIILTFQYLTGFNDIRLTKVEEQRELSYIQKIKDNFIQTFNTSNYSNNGDLNIVIKDINFTKNFLKQDLIKKGISFDSKLLFFSSEFETGDLSKWTSVYGIPEVVSDEKYHGTYSLHCDELENVNKTLPGIGEAYGRLYVNFKKLPRSGAHYFISFNDDNNRILKLGLTNDGGNNYMLRVYYYNATNPPNQEFYSSTININENEWHYFEIYWYENGTNSRIKAWYDGSLGIDVTVDGKGNGKSIDEYSVGLLGGVPPRDLYIDCVAISNDYIGKDCYPDGKPYFTFSLKTREMETNTGFGYEEPTIYDNVLWLKFNEGSGTVAFDSTIYNNYGDIYVSGRNQVKNPSFEMDKQYWGYGSGTWDIVTDEKYNGSKSSKFQDLIGDSDSEETGNVYIPVTPFQDITVSLYSKGNNIIQGSQGWHKAYMIGRWVNSTMDEYGAPCCPDMTIGDGVGTWNWKRTSYTHNPPAGAAYYRFGAGLIESGIGTLWIDSVQVEYGSILTEFIDTPWTSGKFGSALEFDGRDDYVSVADKVYFDNIPQITVMGWFKLNQLASVKGESEVILTKKHTISPSESYSIRQNTDNTLRFILYNTSGGSVQAVSDTVQAGQWYHVAGVYNGSAVKIYLNGILNDTKSFTGNVFDSNYPLIIGEESPSANRFKGLIDEVKIWGRALSQAEIQTEMNKA